MLPGVTVEASSPVLIEATRSAVTDDQGRYRVVDLRPGVYKLTFTLAGFGMVVRQGIELPSEFVATVNVDLKVAALAETVTVSGASPLVDVQQVSKTQVLTREMIDSCQPRATFSRSAFWFPASASARLTSAGRERWSSHKCGRTASISAKPSRWLMACR